MRKQRYHAWKRMAACILTAAMMLTMPEATAFADETDAAVTCTEKCEHHQEHTKDCGYTEGKEGVPCGHEHTKACYTLVKECVHEHEESCYQTPEKNGLAETATPSDADKLVPTRCSHECSKESGCITEKLDCAHKQGGGSMMIPVVMLRRKRQLPVDLPARYVSPRKVEQTRNRLAS